MASVVLAIIGLLLAIAVVIVCVPILIGILFVVVYYGIRRLVEYWKYGE